VNALDMAVARSNMPRTITLIAPTAAAPAAVAGAVAPVRRRGAYAVWSDEPVLG
jgi:glycerol dehydrogenase-like iron-containing ADH family enzyme